MIVKIFRQNLIPLFIVTLILVYAYINSFKIFYQQDEWHALGIYFTYSSISDLVKNFNFYSLIFGEGRPLSILIGYLLMFNFPFNTVPLSLYSLFFHLINSFLVYFLSMSLFKNKMVSTVASIFFAICSVTSGTVTWYSTSIGTLPAVCMILSSLLTFFKGVRSDGKWLWYTFLLLYLSLYLKEIGYFLFAVLPVIYLIYKRVNWKRFIKDFWYFIVVFFVITLYRYLQLNNYSKESSVFIQSTDSGFLISVLFRALLYPLTSFSLVFVPSDFFLRFAKFFTSAYYPFFPSEHFNLIVQSSVLELLAVILSFSILGLIFVLLLRENSRDRKNILSLIILTFLSYTPYIILSKSYAYLDSRYFYLSSAFSALILGYIIYSLYNLLKNYILKFLVLLIFISYLLGNILSVRNEIKNLSDLSQERLTIIKSFKQMAPTLRDKNIFYVTGDRDYYLIKGNNLPFQQGMGFTLMTLYAKDENRFDNLLKQKILWELGSQGYFEDQGTGFGYFWDKGLLKKTLKEKEISRDNVKAFYYDSKTRRLSNISLDNI